MCFNHLLGRRVNTRIEIFFFVEVGLVLRDLSLSLSRSNVWLTVDLSRNPVENLKRRLIVNVRK